jgi:hypothetical protein
MKTRIFIFLLCGTMSLFSCKKESINILGGTQAKNGGVGVTVTATTTVAGVSSIAGSVKTLQDGISTFSGTAVVTNTTIKNVLTNVPGMVINGNNVSTTSVKFKLTSEGIESIAPLDPGVIVNFSSKAGDTYTGSTGVKRTVASVSSTDDFSWGGMLIKVYKIEENPNKLGIKKITYWANHNFGLVSIEFTFDDNSVAKFPLSMSTNI